MPAILPPVAPRQRNDHRHAARPRGRVMLLAWMLLFGLGGCGKKGPLYLPEPPKGDAATQTGPAPEAPRR